MSGRGGSTGLIDCHLDRTLLQVPHYHSVRPRVWEDRPLYYASTNATPSLGNAGGMATVVSLRLGSHLD
jgi:hypothetical protein